MINFRQVTPKYYLSGGWSNIKEDPTLLSYYNIKAVLDLQFVGDEGDASAWQVHQNLEPVSIEYTYLDMPDITTYNPAELDDLFEIGHEILTTYETSYPKAGHKILVKCGMGNSRSPAMLAYHLCKKDDISYQAVINMFKDAEEGVSFIGSQPNEQFAAVLRKRFPFK